MLFFGKNPVQDLVDIRATLHGHQEQPIASAATDLVFKMICLHPSNSMKAYEIKEQSFLKG